MALGLAVLSAFAWGVVDFVSKLALNRRSPITVFLYMQGLALIPLTVLAWPELRLAASWSQATLLLSLATAAAYVVSYLLLLRAFQIGLVAIVSPIFAAWSVVAMILAVPLFAEQLLPVSVLAVLFVLAGLYLAARQHGEGQQGGRGLVPGASTALAGTLVMAIMNLLWRPLTARVGEDAAVWQVKALALLMLFLAMTVWTLWQKRPRNWGWLHLDRASFVPVLAAGWLDTVGMVAFAAAMQSGAVALVAPISSACPLVTIALAAVYLKERLSRSQYAGIALALAGVFLAAGKG